MLRAARHHTMAHLHFLLSELHRYQRLSAEVTLAIIHIDDLTDLMEDLHVHGHPVFVSLQDARLNLVTFQQTCYQAITATVQRLDVDKWQMDVSNVGHWSDSSFVRLWRDHCDELGEMWISDRWMYRMLVTEVNPLSCVCGATIVTNLGRWPQYLSCVPAEKKESGCASNFHSEWFAHIQICWLHSIGLFFFLFHYLAVIHL